MLTFTKRSDPHRGHFTTLTLTLEQRTKRRLLVTLDDGTEAGLLLERGYMLRDGDCVASDDGLTVRICAAPEAVSTVRTTDPALLARVSYHLGNRHVPLQVGPGMVRYQHDHVLDEMVRGLGLTPKHEWAPFEPEPGAYGEHHAGHAHGHRH